MNVTIQDKLDIFTEPNPHAVINQREAKERITDALIYRDLDTWRYAINVLTASNIQRTMIKPLCLVY